MKGSFKTQRVDFKIEGYHDKGVQVKDLINLIQGNEIYDEVRQLLDVDEILDDFIPIPGASRLVQAVSSLEGKFTKFDLDSEFKDTHFCPSGNASNDILFQGIADPKVLGIVENDELIAQPIRSSLRDFFNELYGMDKYATTLIAQGHHKVLRSSLDLLKAEGLGKPKRYRLLMNGNGDFYLRAVVSDRYQNYDNSIAVALGLLFIYKESMKSKDGFRLDSFEMNESMIRVFLIQDVQKRMERIGNVSYLLEISNDEIKRAAFKLSGALSIGYGTSPKKDSGSVYIKPKDSRYKIVAIPHSLKPEKAIAKLKELGHYKETEQQLFEDVKKIGQIKKPDQIRHILKDKIDNSFTDDIKKYKGKISGELLRRVDSIHELLKLFNKIEMIAEDIEAKEYLRYLAYTILIDRHKGS